MAEVTLPAGKYVTDDISCLNLNSGAKATEFNTMYGDGIIKFGIVKIDTRNPDYNVCSVNPIATSSAKIFLKQLPCGALFL
jgi:hypothetical protein